MGSLDQLVRGMAVGAIRTIDPVSTGIQWIDRWFWGIGPSNKDRAVPTAVAAVYQSMYPKPQEKLEGKTYWARAAGHGIGAVGTACAVAATAVYLSPIVAVAAPIALGAYGIARAVGRYVHDFTKGEKIGKTYQKSSFFDGYKFGYHEATYAIPGLAWKWNPLAIAHNLESTLTGRGLDDSHVIDRMAQSAGGMRRNFRAGLGAVVGAAVGSLANIFTLGIYALGKNIVAGVRNYQNRPWQQYRPAYVTAA